jgi:hypothetical protein
MYTSISAYDSTKKYFFKGFDVPYTRHVQKFVENVVDRGGIGVGYCVGDARYRCPCVIEAHLLTGVTLVSRNALG